MKSLMQQYIDSGQANPGKTGSSSSRTDFLIKWETVPKYYEAVYQSLKDEDANATKSIKESAGAFKLKIQLGKYAHPLAVSVDGTAYPTATFATHEEALKAFANFITDLVNGVDVVVRAVRPAWERYARKNDIPFKALESMEESS